MLCLLDLVWLAWSTDICIYQIIPYHPLCCLYAPKTTNTFTKNSSCSAGSFFALKSPWVAVLLVCVVLHPTDDSSNRLILQVWVISFQMYYCNFYFNCHSEFTKPNIWNFVSGHNNMGTRVVTWLRVLVVTWLRVLTESRDHLTVRISCCSMRHCQNCSWYQRRRWWRWSFNTSGMSDFISNVLL